MDKSLIKYGLYSVLICSILAAIVISLLSYFGTQYECFSGENCGPNQLLKNIFTVFFFVLLWPGWIFLLKVNLNSLLIIYLALAVLFLLMYFFVIGLIVGIIYKRLKT